MVAFILIVAYVVLVLVRPQEYPQWADAGIPFLPIALVAALLAWLPSRYKRFDEPQYLLLALFVLVTSLSIAFNGWTGGAMDQFNAFAPTLVAFVLLANTSMTRKRVVFVIGVFTVCAMLLAIHGIKQSATGLGWTGMPLIDDGRIQYLGIFSDPNDLGMLFVICVPMAIFLGSRGGLLGLRRLAWTAGAGLLLYGILLTNSRGSMLALVAMSGAYLWQRRGPTTALVLAAVCLALLKLVPSRLDQLDVQERSASGRVEAWYEGMQMFIANPVIGVGTDRFTEFNPLTAHNSMILVLAENGFIGFILWFAFLGYCFWMMVRILRHDPDLADDEEVVAWRRDRAIAMTLLVSLVGYAATAFFLSRSYVMLPYLLSAVVVAHFTGVRERFPDIRPFNLAQDLIRWLILGCAAVAAFYVMLKVLLAMS